MTFLKVIASIAAAVLLVIFLNNLMAKVFPVKSFSYSSYYDKCSALQRTSSPETAQSVNIPYNQYDKCINNERQKENDEKALLSQYLWMRSIIVLILLVVVSILIFKKFPFFSSAIIGGGLAFAISYPLLGLYGGDFGGGEDLSANIKNQVSLMKTLISFIGFAGLTLADILFFEKEHKETAAQPIQTITPPPVVPPVNPVS